jgi:hypothetical protein
VGLQNGASARENIIGHFSKNLNVNQAWWHTPVTSTFRKLSGRVQGQPGLYSKTLFQRKERKETKKN